MKLLGSLLIIFASISSSYFYEKNLLSRIKNTEALCELIKHIKSKIEYFSLSVNEILNGYSAKNDFITSIIKNKLNFDDSFLDESVIKDVNIFFNTLGKGYKKEQLLLCDYTLSVLEASKDKLKEDFIKKTKLFRSLSIFFGIGCAILLI